MTKPATTIVAAHNTTATVIAYDTAYAEKLVLRTLTTPIIAWAIQSSPRADSDPDAPCTLLTHLATPITPPIEAQHIHIGIWLTDGSVADNDGQIFSDPADFEDYITTQIAPRRWQAELHKNQT